MAPSSQSAGPHREGKARGCRRKAPQGVRSQKCKLQSSPCKWATIVFCTRLDKRANLRKITPKRRGTFVFRSENKMRWASELSSPQDFFLFWLDLGFSSALQSFFSVGPYDCASIQVSVAQFLQKKTRECGHAKLDVKWKKRSFLGAIANCGQRVGLVIFHLCVYPFSFLSCQLFRWQQLKQPKHRPPHSSARGAVL